jgi:hypothetical protein
MAGARRRTEPLVHLAARLVNWSGNKRCSDSSPRLGVSLWGLHSWWDPPSPCKGVELDPPSPPQGVELDPPLPHPSPPFPRGARVQGVGGFKHLPSER